MTSHSQEFREDFLANVAFFAKFTPHECQLLAPLLEEVEFSANAMIVREGELVQHIFLIIEGTAEVLATAEKGWNFKKNVPIATLSKYESIGLNQLGFFSQTGLRTASVRASTPVSAFSLSIDEFQEFIKLHPRIHEEMTENFDLITRMNFIKQAEPFASLTPQTIQTIAAQIEKIHIKKDDVIFKQGEIGDSCYLIEAGEVEVYVTDETGEERSVTTIGKGKLFGEIALLTSLPRNATIRAIEDCELLVIHREKLFHLLENQAEVSNYLMKMMVSKSRPRHYENISAFHQTMADKEEMVVLKNMQTLRYFRLSAMGWFVWQLLDGQHTLQDIALAVFEEYKVFSIEALVGLIASLHQAGFVELYQSSSLSENKTFKTAHTWWESLFLSINKIMEARYVFPNIDPFLTRVYQSGGYLLFSRFSQILFITILLLGGIAFIKITNPALQALTTTPLIWLLLIIFILPTISVILHEFAHALATKAFGQQVHAFGVGWYWMSPIAFTDTSDMWLSTPRKRIFVNLAGIYSDATFSGLACIAAYFMLSSCPQFAGLLWIFALINYLSILKNLDPMLEFDGYYVLNDLLDMPRLREEAVLMLTQKPNLAMSKQHWKEVIYWLLTFAHLAITMIIVILLQHYIFVHIFPSVYHSSIWTYAKWILPILILIASSMNIWIIAKSQRIDI